MKNIFNVQFVGGYVFQKKGYLQNIYLCTMFVVCKF